MKKWLILSSLILSWSYMNSANAIDPVTTGVAAGVAAKAAIEGTAAAAAAGAVGVGVAAAVASPVAGIAGGFGAAKVMNDQFFTECEDNKKAACDAAQMGTYTGAGVGTVGVLGAVAAAGASSAGLATIGSAIGGGAIAGAATLVAAPIVAAAAIGGATYWWFTRDNGDETSPAVEGTVANNGETAAEGSDQPTDTVADNNTPAVEDPAPAGTETNTTQP